MSADNQEQRDAIKAFVNIAIVEGMALMAVVGVYLYTNNLTYLVGGIIGVLLIFGPMILRRVMALQEAQKRQRDLGGGNG